MKTKAEEWAEWVARTDRAHDVALQAKPCPPEGVWTHGGYLRFEVAASGLAVVTMEKGGLGTMGGTVDLSSMEQFRLACRWVLDTFGEPARLPIDPA
jgi:hypothetical protein